VLHGAPGTGKLRAARWLHALGRRAAAAPLLVEGDQPDTTARVERLCAELGRSPVAATASVEWASVAAHAASPAGLPGALIIARAHRAPDALAVALQQLLAAQGAGLRVPVVLLSCDALLAMRAQGPAWAALLAQRTPVSIELPPLAARVDDIPSLARSLATAAARACERPLRGITPAATAALCAHTYRGHVRELQALVTLAVEQGRGDWLERDDLALPHDGPSAATAAREFVVRLPGVSLREVELGTLRLALDLADGRIIRAAELLGITRHALRRKLEKFGLHARHDGREDAPTAAPDDDELDHATWELERAAAKG
jgi:hypothetical protein